MWPFKKKKIDPLDTRLLSWRRGDPFTIADMLRSVVCFGQTGSGKSSGSGYGLARAILGTNAGMLILCSKPEDRGWWLARTAEAGRSEDVILFAEDSKERINFLDFESKSRGDARTLTQFLMTASEVLIAQGQRDQEAFWRSLNERIIYNAVVPVLTAYGKADAPSIQQFINTAAYDTKQLADPGWLARYHNQTMAKADKADKTSIERFDFDQAKEFWPGEFASMDDKPRSSGLLGVNNCLHTFNSGLVRELCSTTTTFTPLDMEKGAIVIADFPIPTYQLAGKFVCSGLKYLTQRHILRRTFTSGEPPIVI